MAAVVRVVHRAILVSTKRQWRYVCLVIIATVLVLMTAHVLEILVWSRHRWGTPAGADRVYFAFVNYTTLGYGDITPVQDWRLLGPLIAMNGVMLFGWSSAVIFEVLRRTMRRVDLIDGPK
jgi:Ion channel